MKEFATDRRPVRLPFAGSRSKIVSRVLIATFFVLLSLSGFFTVLPIHVSPTRPASPSSQEQGTRSGAQSLAPRFPGASSVLPLPFPQTIVSAVDRLAQSGGVIQTSSNNLTLHNTGISVRLLGEPSPHDILLRPGHAVLSSLASWHVEAQVGSAWFPLAALSNNFTLLGTNSTGTYVLRTMDVEAAPFGGRFDILYTASSSRSLKWDLSFTSSFPTNYRMVFDWTNVTIENSLTPTSRQIQAKLGTANYTFSWADIASNLNTTSVSSGTDFSLFVNLGTIESGATISVDPYIVASSNAGPTTAFSFQRKVFYEPTGGYYFAFYNDGYFAGYSSSKDGQTWSAIQYLFLAIPNWPLSPDSNFPSILNYGKTVVVVAGEAKTSTNGCSPAPCQWSNTVKLYYARGNVSGGNIQWGTIATAASVTRACYSNMLSCSMTLGIRDVSVGVDVLGRLAFSYNYYSNATGTGGYCSFSNTNESAVIVTFNGFNPFIECQTSQNIIKSIILPYPGGAQLVYQLPIGGGATQLKTVWFGVGSGWVQGPKTIIDPNVKTGDSFSATSDSSNGIHVLYQGLDGNVSYAYLSPSSSNWSFSKNVMQFSSIFFPYLNSPTISVDHSTDDIYAFIAIASGGGNVEMKRKPLLGNWTNSALVGIASSYNQPIIELDSNAVAQGATNSSMLTLIWTQGGTSVVFASIPIQTVWSPFASPSDPWDGNGIAPDAQYFSNLGEYVSVSTGMLSVRQTDLDVPGRGLDLSITRVYTEPDTFLARSPMSYENYPWAPVGTGWQLNYPWFNNTAYPSYIHLWDGQGYEVPWSFWTGSTGTFENHAGLHLKLVRNSDSSVILYTADGTKYDFDSSHRLVNITDTTGMNSIKFAYTNNVISCITDTVGRSFSFAYAAGPLLSAIAQTSGVCGQGTIIRQISYNYSGSSLTTVTDPAGRKTTFLYKTTVNTGSTPWFLTRITYPTQWYTNYTYAPVAQGTEAVAYRVSAQYVGYGIPSTRVRELDFSYTNGAGATVTNSTIAAYNGTSTQPVGYTSYLFTFGGIQWIAYNSTHGFLRGHQEIFGVHGEIVQHTTLVTLTSGYTNYYRYDLWGNMIYSRSAISSTSSHESFKAYYNDGLPLGFNAFQETFSQNGGNATDNTWKTLNGIWEVKNGVYNGTDTSGNQEDMLAYADIGKSDISIQASVYIGSEVNLTGQQPDRVGIFTHYNASTTKSYKWALAIYDNGTAYNLGLLDEFNGYGWKASVPCPISTGNWYSFNMSVSGTRAAGSLTGSGISPCQLTYNFSSTSPAVSGTSFGLYAGGFTALFDNVKVTTVSPFITGTGFSNSFYPSSPNSNVHDSLAGVAELQSGNNTTPVETYYGYYSTGALKQVKQLNSCQGCSPWVSSSRTYDSYGNLASITDPMGNYTYYRYSVQYQNAYLTNETRVLTPAHTKVTDLYSYNLTMGTMLSTVDPNGYNTTYQYDILDRFTSINYPRSLGFVAYTYNDTANYVQTTNENGWKTRQYYDGLGRLSQITRFLNGGPYSNESYTHNWQDKIVTDNDPLGDKITYQYDSMGRITSTVEPNGNVTQVSYNDTGGWVRYKNESGIYKCSVYDRRGGLIDVIEAASSNCTQGTVATYLYYENGGLAQVYSTGIFDTYYYDSLNRVAKVIHLDRTTDSYLYDNNGNVISWTNRKGVVTTYAYDSLNRLTGITYHGTTTTSDSYTYDSNGNLLQLQSQNVTVTRVYDPRNRMTCETYQVNQGLANGPCYNGNGPVSGGISRDGYSYQYYYLGENMIQLTYNDFMTANYAYDGLGRVANVSYSSPRLTTSFSYYSNDQVKGVNYGNGLVQNYIYDRNARVQQIKLLNGTTTPLLLNYQYNKTGTVSGVTGQIMTTTGSIVGISESYKYDPIGRLTNSTTKTGSTNTNLWYMYDPIGNRMAQGMNGTATGGHWQTTTYNYNSLNNELSSSFTNGTTTQYGYDSNGNLLTKNVGTTTHWTYTWNVQGQMLKAANDTGAQGYYAYDGFGRRVESKENNYYVFYGYLGTETLGETGTFGPDNDYVYANGIRIAMVNNAAGSHPTVVSYHTDVLGNTRLVTSSTRSVLFSDSYQPFGQDNSSSGSQTYKYAGKPVSQTTGLYYEYQRWYDPTVGRFISQDPSPGTLTNLQSENPYVYTENTPTSYTDPTGMYIAGNTHACIDYCNYQTSIDLTTAFFVLLTSVDTHHWGSPGGSYFPDTDYGYRITRDPIDYQDPNSATATDQSLSDTQLGSSSAGPGGARPVELGKQAEGAGLNYLAGEGNSLADISSHETFDLPGGGRIRPDFGVYKSGQLREIVEVKGGVASGEAAETQLTKYNRYAQSRGVSLTYILLKMPSRPFAELLQTYGVRVVPLY